jgi:toxin YoeB
MNILFTEAAWKDFEWLLDNDRKLAQRVRRLLKEITRDPEQGLGKPEKLKFQLAGCWSRRINEEHRLIYTVEGDNLIVLSCRYHYES